MLKGLRDGNSGGVAVSGLEMAQNSQRLQWSPEEVDAKLKDIMKNCYEICYETAKDYAPASKEGTLPSLVRRFRSTMSVSLSLVKWNRADTSRLT